MSKCEFASFATRSRTCTCYVITFCVVRKCSRCNFTYTELWIRARRLVHVRPVNVYVNAALTFHVHGQLAKSLYYAHFRGHVNRKVIHFPKYIACDKEFPCIIRIYLKWEKM